MVVIPDINFFIVGSDFQVYKNAKCDEVDPAAVCLKWI